MLRALHFVYERDGIIFERNLAFAVVVVEDVVLADAGICRCARPGAITTEGAMNTQSSDGLLLQQIVKLARAANTGLELLVSGGELRRVDEFDSVGSLQAGRAADAEEALRRRISSRPRGWLCGPDMKVVHVRPATPRAGLNALMMTS